MASPAAEVSLHCVICFEEFDIRERPPVVLPCGHTYVCLVCAKRLNRCMECREPLFWHPPVAKAPPANMHMNGRSPAPGNRYGARGRYSPAPQTPPHPSMHPPVKEEPVPLPLPKNTVLMGMIEAAERQKRLLQGNIAMATGNLVDECDEEEDEFLVNPILAGMSAFVGACGTYAVKETSGLAVLPFDPNMQHHSRPDEEKKEDKPREPFTIEPGQTVQVVNVDEGVYQLARGAGFIVATVNQLVKVGDPLEKSCQLEGMLQSVKKKQQELQDELQQINTLASGLEDDIKLQLQEPENHPVITPLHETEKVEFNDENDRTAVIQLPATPPKISKLEYSPQTGLHSTQSTDSTNVQLGDAQIDPHTPRTPAHNQNAILLNSPANSCPMPIGSRLEQPYIDCESQGLPRYRVNSDDDLHGLTWGFGCGSALFGERLLEQDANSGNVMTLSFDDILVDSAGAIGVANRASNMSSSVNGGGGETAYSTDSSLQSGSFDGGGVNFRTGMSGHRGLSQARKKTSPMSRYRQIPMMSAHRGIPAARGAPVGLQPRRPQGTGSDLS